MQKERDIVKSEFLSHPVLQTPRPSFLRQPCHQFLVNLPRDALCTCEETHRNFLPSDGRLHTLFCTMLLLSKTPFTSLSICSMKNISFLLMPDQGDSQNIFGTDIDEVEWIPTVHNSTTVQRWWLVPALCLHGFVIAQRCQHVLNQSSSDGHLSCFQYFPFSV